MNRYYCMLLIFTACLIVAGCRRSGPGTPRNPVPVKKETDILPVPHENYLLFEAKPVNRRFRFFMQSFRAVEKELEGKDEFAKKTHWQNLAAAQELMETSAQAVASKLRVAQDREDRKAEFDDFAKIALNFLKNNTPKDYSREEFTKHVRRKEFVISEKFLDKVDWVVVTNDIPLTQYLESRKMIFIPQADLSLIDPCIIAYHATGETGSHHVMMGNGIATQMKIEDIKDELKKQELRVLRHHYLAFAAPHFLIAPVAAQDDLWVKGFQVSPEGALKAKIDLGEKQFPKVNYLKKPADPREWLKFKKYMRENSPPPIYKDIVDMRFAVNLEALPGNRDMLGRSDPIACYAKADKYRPQGADTDLDGFWTVDMGGTVDLRSAAMVEFFLPKGNKDAKAP